ncbi:MAG: hypothetical protein WA156_01615 [Methylocystis silviterrae]
MTPNKWKLTWRDFGEFRYRRQQPDLRHVRQLLGVAERDLLLLLAAVIISAVKV